MSIYLIEELLDESNRQDLINYCGVELADKFRSMKKNFPYPYKDQYYWISNNFSTTDFSDYMDEFQLEPSERAQRDAKAAEGTTHCYEDDNWLILKIDNYEAASKYGKGTKWCIAGTKEYEDGKNGKWYFDKYHNAGVKIYYYIPKNASSHKWAATVTGSIAQIFNELDETVGVIPNAPAFEPVDRAEKIVMEKVFDGRIWKIEQPINPRFHDCYIITNKKNHAEEFKCDLEGQWFQDGEQRWYNRNQFMNKSDSCKEVVELAIEEGIFEG